MSIFQITQVKTLQQKMSKENNREALVGSLVVLGIICSSINAKTEGQRN